ncbi:caldesmon-like [Penaeus indicus]|uniref:caldesmon-like n=1 Tax=Penaeus indicus TaxID=29960 RepID=UPI00300CBE7C
MLSPNVPEFVPRGMQSTGPTGGYERTIPPVVERHHTSQSSIQTIRAERKQEDGQQRRVQNASLLEPERRDLKDSFGGKKGGGSNRGRHGSYSSYTRDRDSLRSYDNWRQRVDENPTDRQGSYFKSTRRPTKGDSEGDCNKNRSQQGKQRPWRQKGESQERENVQNKEGKKTVGRGKNIAIGPTHATEAQSPSYCKPGVSYGKILAGDFAWGGKTAPVGDGGNHPKNSNDSGLIQASNAQQDEQWPSLPGFHTRALAKGERVEAESPRGRATSLAPEGARIDSVKDPALKESNKIGKEGVEATKGENEDLSRGKWTSSDEKKVGEKDDKRQSESATVCEIRRNENALKEGHTGQRHDSLDLKPVPREGEKKYTNRSPRGKDTSNQQPEEKQDGNFEWQVKRDRRKQVKSHEETTKLSVSVQQQKGEKNRKGKADVNPSFAKGKAVSKSETKSTNQHTMKNKPHVVTTSANKISRKIKQNSPGQQDQSAVDGLGVSSLADKASTKNNGSVPVDAKKPITSEKDSSKLKAKKLKKKEEKMKIREQQIRKAQEMMKKDSKLSMITKAFLESAAYTGSGGQTSVMSKTAGQSLFENFPSLGEQRPYNVKRNVKGNAVPPATSKSGSHEDSRERNKPRNPSVPLAGQASGSGTASGSVTSTSVSSYSGVLLASPRRAAESQSRAMDDSQVKDTRNVVAQKKKVKTRDRIELDLMCAALESKKRKEKELSDKILMSELHPGLEKPKRSMETHTVVKGSKNAFAGHLRAKVNAHIL